MGQKCLFPRCNRTKENYRLVRGLCDVHYAYAHKLVQAGATSWEDLEKRGKCLPAKFKPAKGLSSWFLDEK